MNLFESRNDVQKFLDKNITALNPDLQGIAGNCMDGRPITETRVKRGILNYPSYPGAEIGQILTVMAAARSARISEQEVLRGLNTYLKLTRYLKFAVTQAKW